MLYPAKNRPNSSLNQSGIGENRPYPDWVTQALPRHAMHERRSSWRADVSRAGVLVMCLISSAW
jgi:hypothetical protein